MASVPAENKMDQIANKERTPWDGHQNVLLSSKCLRTKHPKIYRTLFELKVCIRKVSSDKA